MHTGRRADPELVRLALFLGVLLGVLIVLLAFRDVFFPLLLGLGIAYLLDPAVTWFERHGRSRFFGVVATTLLVLLVMAGLVLYVVPTVSEQIQRLGARLPQYEERLESLVAPWLAQLEARYPTEFHELPDRLADAIRQNLPQVAGSLATWLGSVFSNLLSLLLFLLNLIFVPVFAFYLLIDWPRIKAVAYDLIPVLYREVTVTIFREVDQAMASFLRGQLTIALILAAINTVGLMLVGVPLALLIGALAGLANLIPYMALVVGLVPALLLCWVEHESLARLAGVGAVFGGAQLLEGTVLSPRILAKTVNLHPVWVLLALIAGGSLLGFFGLLISVPAAAAIQVFARHGLQAYRRSQIYRGGTVPGRAETAAARNEPPRDDAPIP